MKQLPPFLAKLNAYDPDFCGDIKQTYTTAMSPGAIGAKTKLLILLALDAYAGSTGVKGIAALARRHGATDDEIRECLRIPVAVAANKVVNTSLSAFEA